MYDSRPTHNTNVVEDVLEADTRELSKVSTFDRTPAFARETAEASCKYMNYMDRQVKEMKSWRINQEFRCGVESRCLCVSGKSSCSTSTEKCSVEKSTTSCCESWRAFFKHPV